MDKDKSKPEEKKSEPPRSSGTSGPRGTPLMISESRTTLLSRDNEGLVIPIRTSRFKDRPKREPTPLAENEHQWKRKPSIPHSRLEKFKHLDLAISADAEAGAEVGGEVTGTGQQLPGSARAEPGSPRDASSPGAGVRSDKPRRQLPGSSASENDSMYTPSHARLTFGEHTGTVSRPWKTKSHAHAMPGLYERTAREEGEPGTSSFSEPTSQAANQRRRSEPGVGVTAQRRRTLSGPDDVDFNEDNEMERDVVPLYTRRLSERQRRLSVAFGQFVQDKEIHQQQKKDKDAIIVELTETKAEGMFGYYSKLGVGEGVLPGIRRTSDVEGTVSTKSQPSGDASGPDKTWLIGSMGSTSISSSASSTSSVKKNPEPRAQINLAYQNHVESGITPILLLMTFLGRMPFVLRCPSELNKFKRMDYVIRKCSYNYITFCFSSIIMAFVLAMSLVSTCHILSNNGSTDGYEKLEILYVQKYWLQYALFIFSLILIFTYNLSILIYGHELGKYLSDMFASASRFHCDATKRVWLYSGINIVSLGVICSYFWYGYDYGTPGLRGGTTLITISITHFIYPGIRVNGLYFDSVNRCVLVLQIYALISARMVMALPVLYSVIIRNLAVHWNLRTALTLKGLSAKGDTKLKEIKKIATHRFLFRFHLVITALVRGLSDDQFLPTFLVYFGLQFSAIVLTLYKVSKTLGITFDKDDDSGLGDGKVEHVDEPYRDGRSETVTDAAILLFISMSGFLATAELLAQCSHKVRRGYYHVLRHGINAKHVIERRFVLSLIECFTSPRPLLLSPGNYIELTRSFIAALLGGALMIFSIMIQTESNSLVTTPILGLCEGSVVCVVGFAVGPRKQVNTYNENVKKMGDKIFPLMPMMMNTTKMTIMTMAPTTMSTTTMPTTTMSTTTMSTTTMSTTTMSTTTMSTTTTTTMSTTPASPYMSSGGDMSEHFIRCPFTDIIRQKVYNEHLVEIPFPTDRLECVAQPYKRGTKYFDAFGNKVTADFDGCGGLRLPSDNNFKINDLTERHVVSSTMIYPKLFPDNAGPGLSCWGLGDYVSRENLLDPNMISPYFCGHPREWTVFFCQWSTLEWSSSEFQTKFQAKAIEIEKADTGNGSKGICREDTYDVWIRQGQKVFPKAGDPAVTSGINLLPTRTLRLFAYNRDGDILRFKGNARYALHPYLRRSLTNPTIPYGYYDCFGIKLDQFDDCGNLPFSITKIVGRKYQRMRPQLKTYIINGASYKCWVHQFDGFYTCGFQGVPGDSVIEQNIPKICGQFKRFTEGGNYSDYFRSD